MPNSSYWQDRFTQIEAVAHNKGIKAYSEIENIYQKAQRELENKINTWYQRFAINNDVSMAEARKMLNAKELKELKWTVEDYIKYGKENALNKQWIKELENSSAGFHISRLESLKLQTQQSLEVLYGNQLDIVDKTMRNIYSESLYRTAFEVQKGFGVGFAFDKLDENRLSKVIGKPWAMDGVNFSNRIWKNKEKLINELHGTLVRNIISGSDPVKAIKEIENKTNVSRSAAGRLIMTESAYFSSVAQKDMFNELDVEKYQIVATLDNRTSEICSELDGKVFDMKDYEAGVTAPPFHPNCRTTTIPYFDDWEELGVDPERIARDEEGNNYYVPADMTYKEWEKEFVEKESSHKGIIRDSRIDRTVINSNEYDKKLNKLGENPDVTRSIKDGCRDILKHRDGSKYEDIVFINGNTGDMIKRMDYNVKQRAAPSKKMMKMLEKEPAGTIIAIHNHPDSTLPSASDLAVAYNRKYKYGLIACHNGDIYKYSVSRPFGNMENMVYNNRFDKFNSGEYNSIEEFFVEIEENTGVRIEKL